MGFENLRGEPVRLFLSSLTQNVEVAVAPDGTFDIPQVLSGTYNAYLRIGNQATSVGVQARIVVGDENISGLELPAPRPLTVAICHRWGRFRR
jgi:hypothetical protein